MAAAMKCDICGQTDELRFDEIITEEGRVVFSLGAYWDYGNAGSDGPRHAQLCRYCFERGLDSLTTKFFEEV